MTFLLHVILKYKGTMKCGLWVQFIAKTGLDLKAIFV